jgi:hypothetical protein
MPRANAHDQAAAPNALKVALAIVLCFVLCFFLGFAAAEDSKGQACQSCACQGCTCQGCTCQGCTCSGSREVHPAGSLEECIQGCSVLQLVCTGRDIIPTTTVIGLGFEGRPKDVPKDCTIRTIPNGGMLTDQPASTCAKRHDRK